MLLIKLESTKIKQTNKIIKLSKTSKIKNYGRTN